ncbi:MAG TPA: ABC transporter permease subunit [Pilimelia sp.]|nr:ABC transporter permease subunit [Pilimelia sp.]
MNRVADAGWRHAVAALSAAFSVLPLLFVAAAAVSPAGELSSTGLLPAGASADNVVALVTTRPFLRWCGNTLLVAGLAAAVSVLLSAAAAYAFSRLRFRGHRAGLVLLLLLQMFPQFLAIVTLYLIFAEVTELWPAVGFNTPWGLIILYAGGALGVNTWLMKGFFDAVPRDLDEAAALDGAGHAQVFVRILLPLVTPVLVVTGLLVFIATVNEFLLAHVFLGEPRSRTLAVGMSDLIAEQRDRNLGMFCAATLLTAVPTVLAFRLLQRFLTAGLTGAVSRL